MAENLSRGEFEQFVRHMDERHTEDVRRHNDLLKRIDDQHEDVMRCFTDLPCKDHKEKIGKSFDRIDRLERWRYYMAGIAASAGAMMLYMREEVKGIIELMRKMPGGHP
jgi:hypothetical protein